MSLMHVLVIGKEAKNGQGWAARHHHMEDALRQADPACNTLFTGVDTFEKALEYFDTTLDHPLDLVIIEDNVDLTNDELLTQCARLARRISRGDGDPWIKVPNEDCACTFELLELIVVRKDLADDFKSRLRDRSASAAA